MPKKAKVTDRYDSILLEGIRSDFRVVAESVAVLQDKVVSLEQRFNGLGQRFDEMEESVHLQMLRTKNEIVGQIAKRVDPLEHRVSRCESDIGELKSART